MKVYWIIEATEEGAEVITQEVVNLKTINRQFQSLVDGGKDPDRLFISYNDAETGEKGAMQIEDLE